MALETDISRNEREGEILVGQCHKKTHPRQKYHLFHADNCHRCHCHHKKRLLQPSTFQTDPNRLAVDIFCDVYAILVHRGVHAKIRYRVWQIAIRIDEVF
jgi:hypothetical protein